MVHSTELVKPSCPAAGSLKQSENVKISSFNKHCCLLPRRNLEQGMSGTCDDVNLFSHLEDVSVAIILEVKVVGGHIVNELDLKSQTT